MLFFRFYANLKIATRVIFAGNWPTANTIQFTAPRPGTTDGSIIFVPSLIPIHFRDTISTFL